MHFIVGARLLYSESVHLIYSFSYGYVTREQVNRRYGMTYNAHNI